MNNEMLCMNLYTQVRKFNPSLPCFQVPVIPTNFKIRKDGHEYTIDLHTEDGVVYCTYFSNTGIESYDVFVSFEELLPIAPEIAYLCGKTNPYEYKEINCRTIEDFMRIKDEFQVNSVV